MEITTIKRIVSEALDDVVYFDEFSQQAIQLGVQQIVLDLVKREHIYYGHDGEYHIDPLPADYSFAIKTEFDKDLVMRALSEFDKQTISPRVFMSKIAAAGVMMAIAFLNQKRALYIGLSGQFYLEEWV